MKKSWKQVVEELTDEKELKTGFGSIKERLIGNVISKALKSPDHKLQISATELLLKISSGNYDKENQTLTGQIKELEESLAAGTLTEIPLDELRQMLTTGRPIDTDTPGTDTPGTDTPTE